jgi:hypothetical protein
MRLFTGEPGRYFLMTFFEFLVVGLYFSGKISRGQPQ